MKAIITLRGSANLGKTTILHMFANDLIKNGAKAINLLKDDFDADTIKDFEISLEYKSLKIAIFSSGDIAEVVQDNIKKANKIAKFDLVFTAIRSHGKSANFIQNFAKEHKIKIINVENNEYFKENEKILTYHKSQIEYLNFILREF
ncbi:hypothetical protein [Campylobacter majalis]|uniref:hypothetical protein n=1 Tax=Campylobacter majalis TaxID=2790656 RepID=UPI003D691F44